MHSYRLQVFHAVARYRSYSRAAREALHISQPAVSKHVQALEAELGVPLVQRVGKRVDLTDAGRLVQQYADQVLALAEETQRALLSPFAEFASASSKLYSHPLSPFAHTPMADRVSAGLDLMHRLSKEYEKPEFNITSVNGLSALGNEAYSAAKAGLDGLMRALAVEAGPSGVTVNSVLPGYIWGATLEGYFKAQAEARKVSPEVVYREVAAKLALGSIPGSEEIAGAVLFFASQLSSVVTGQSLDVNGGQVMA